MNATESLNAENYDGCYQEIKTTYVKFYNSLFDLDASCCDTLLKFEELERMMNRIEKQDMSEEDKKPLLDQADHYLLDTHALQKKQTEAAEEFFETIRGAEEYLYISILKRLYLDVPEKSYINRFLMNEIQFYIQNVGDFGGLGYFMEMNKAKRAIEWGEENGHSFEAILSKQKEHSKSMPGGFAIIGIDLIP